LYSMMRALNFGGGAFSLSKDEGEAIKVNNVPYHVKLSSKQTNGRFVLMEGVIFPGEGKSSKHIKKYSPNFLLKNLSYIYIISKMRCSTWSRVNYSFI
jgi:hypothetical protein